MNLPRLRIALITQLVWWASTLRLRSRLDRRVLPSRNVRRRFQAVDELRLVLTIDVTSGASGPARASLRRRCDRAGSCDCARVGYHPARAPSSSSNADHLPAGPRDPMPRLVAG